MRVSDTQYLLLYHDSLEPLSSEVSPFVTAKSYGTFGELGVLVATIPSSIDGYISLSNATVLYGSQMSYSFAATYLANGTVLVAYTDAANNYGVTIQSIIIESIDEATQSVDSNAVGR